MNMLGIAAWALRNWKLVAGGVALMGATLTVMIFIAHYNHLRDEAAKVPQLRGEVTALLDDAATAAHEYKKLQSDYAAVAAKVNAGDAKVGELHDQITELEARKPLALACKPTSDDLRLFNDGL